MKLVLAVAAALAVASPVLAQGGDSGSMSSMQGMGSGSMVMAAGEGVVKAVDPAAATVTIDHGPIPAFKAAAGASVYKATPPSLLRGVSVGQTVTFQLMQMGDSTTLTAIHAK